MSVEQHLISNGPVGPSLVKRDEDKGMHPLNGSFCKEPTKRETQRNQDRSLLLKMAC